METKKIVLIGPVYPYKGGIAHYTGQMYKCLAEKYKVYMISFSMQYPKFLYKKEQKDYENETFKIDDTKYLINTANPFNWPSVAATIRNLHPDLVIIQWWHPYFSPCYQGILSRLHGIKKLLICHNVFPHERFPFDRALTKAVIKHGDYYIVHSKRDASDLKSIVEDAKFAETVLPTYVAFKFQNMSKEKARKLLHYDINRPLLLFFGFVRKYKGLRYLIEAMPEIEKKIPDVKLMVVGDFGDANNKNRYLEMINHMHAENDIDIYDGYIPDHDIEKYFAASDLVVLPYIDATQSGIVQIAFAFGKPVIVTNVGGLPEVVDNNITGYIIPKEDPDAIAEAATDFFKNNRSIDMEKNVALEADRFSWDHMRETIENLVWNDR